jgi:hypothetical protein
LAVEEEILKDFSCMILSNKGSYWNAKDQVLSIPSCLIFAFSVRSPLGTNLFGVGKIEKGRKLSISLKDHIPTFSSVTAVRSSSGDEAFSAKTDTTVAPIARLHMDSRFIHKFHLR